jgi:hypothetical protein
MNALCLYAGPVAKKHIEQHGLLPAHVRTIPGAAGGPKGLVLGPLDRFIFGSWLSASHHPVHLVGSSIGAWRMTTACLSEPTAAFERLQHDYIRQHFELKSGQKRPTAAQLTQRFSENLQTFYAGQLQQVLEHPRYRLHIITSRGRHLLRREHALRTPVAYLGAFMSNAVHRKAMGAWLERVVFSSGTAELPFSTADYRTRQVRLNQVNFFPALQASCSIPFVLQAVHNIPSAPPGAYWDGGLTDYHLHLNYTAPPGEPGIVLYPHFQQSVVPGWLDKSLKWRHKATGFLDRMVLLAPNPEWVKTLPNSKLPDRTDFTHYGNDLQARVKVWSTAAAASQQLADEFGQWLREPDVSQVLPL